MPTKETYRDIRRLKRKLFLNMHTPLPKCPGKSRRKAQNLDSKLGRAFHSENRHTCEDCQCGNGAGSMTAHYGYGLCKYHEQYLKEEMRDQVAEDHKEAIRQRNPFIYRDADHWLAEVKNDATRAHIQIDLSKELETARSLVQEIVSKCTGAEQAQQKMTDLADEVRNNCAGSDPQILERLDEIRECFSKKSAFKLTELSAGKKVPMSDKTRLELTSKLLYNVGRLSLDHWTVNKHEVITREEFRVWLKDLAVLCRRFIVDPNEWGAFVQNLKDIGEPKSKSV